LFHRFASLSMPKTAMASTPTTPPYMPPAYPVGMPHLDATTLPWRQPKIFFLGAPSLLHFLTQQLQGLSDGMVHQPLSHITDTHLIQHSNMPYFVWFGLDQMLQS